MTLPLMPKATALWLIDNTALTFDQISAFCGLHMLEIQALADEEIGMKISPFDPVAHGQLSWDEIHRCESDPTAHLAITPHTEYMAQKQGKVTPRYTPKILRQDKPDAILWLLKNYPDLTDHQISKLIGTTKATIESIRNKTHRNMANLKPRSPVVLGLCHEQDLQRLTQGHGKSTAQESA